MGALALPGLGRWTRKLLGWLGLVAAYLAAGKLGLALAFVHVAATAVWPPTGIAVAAFVLLGRSVWPAIFVGAFAVNYWTLGSVAVSAPIALGNTLEGLVAAALVQRFAAGRRAFDRPETVLRFVACAAVAAPAISATIGVASLALAGLADRGQILTIWGTWWLGDATGALSVAPLILLWAEPRDPWRQGRAVEACALFGGTIVSALVVFTGLGTAREATAPIEFACMPFPLWAAFRFGRREAVAATVVLSAIAIGGTLQGWGPFARGSPNESLLLLQAYMAVLSVVALATGAAARERGRVERALRERTVELERSNESLREFTHVVSHDLREPLRSVERFAQLLARRHAGRLGADGDEFIEFIVGGAQGMRDLLRGLLDYSQIDAQPLKPESISLDAALDDALEHLHVAIHENSARIVRGPLPMLVGDRVQITRLFQNLVCNAVKYRRPGRSPQVRVEAAQGGEEWIISVTDNGIGIDPRDAERIFAIFQRLHLRGEYPGTGVGLTIARKIVERHGGRLWVEPAASEGSVFRFTLPC